MRILLVEDDDRVAAALSDLLRRHGVLVTRAASGAAALAAGKVDLVLLDLGLPDMDGNAVCRALRRVSDVPIIAVTARAEERDRVLGLRTGADDYVVKPYSSAELLARIEAVLRRSSRSAPTTGVPAASAPATGAEQLQGPPQPTSGSRADSSQQAGGVLRAGALVVDADARRVSMAGVPVQLSRKEFDVLLVLAAAGGAVCTREQILDSVWGATLFGSTRTLDVHVATLRAKLGDTDVVETVRGVGYRLRADPGQPSTGTGQAR